MIVYMVIFLTYLCSADIYAAQPMEIESPFEALPNEVLANIFAHRLEQDNLLGSIRELWKTGKTDKRFDSIITPENIVHWIKVRNIGLVKYTNVDDPLEPYQQMLTPLMQTIRAQDYDMMKLLIAGGQNVNETNPDDLTPLILAADQEDIKALRILLNTKDIDVDKEQHKKYGNFTALSILISRIESQPEMYEEVISPRNLFEILPLIFKHNPLNLALAKKACEPNPFVRGEHKEYHDKACKLLQDYIEAQESSISKKQRK